MINSFILVYMILFSLYFSMEAWIFPWKHPKAWLEPRVHVFSALSNFNRSIRYNIALISISLYTTNRERDMTLENKKKTFNSNVWIL